MRFREVSVNEIITHTLGGQTGMNGKDAQQVTRADDVKNLITDLNYTMFLGNVTYKAILERI